MLRSFEIWELTNRARAYDNHVYMVACNGVGPDAGGNYYFGHSMIVDPIAHKLAQARGTEEVISAALDPDPLKRITYGAASPMIFDHLQDRNLAAYRDILKPGPQPVRAGQAGRFVKLGASRLPGIVLGFCLAQLCRAPDWHASEGKGGDGRTCRTPRQPRNRTALFAAQLEEQELMALNNIWGKNTDAITEVMPEQTMGFGRTLWQAIQHLLTAAGANILGPILMGLDPSMALFTSGIGTLVYNKLVGVPAYMGTSFSYIATIALIMAEPWGGQTVVGGGIIAAGLTSIVIGLIVRLIGWRWIDILMPPVVLAMVVIAIGLLLAPVAYGEALSYPPLAILTFGLGVIFATKFGRGRVGALVAALPVLLSIVIGYIVALIMGKVDLSCGCGGAVVRLAPLIRSGFRPACHRSDGAGYLDCRLDGAHRSPERDRQHHRTGLHPAGEPQPDGGRPLQRPLVGRHAERDLWREHGRVRDHPRL